MANVARPGSATRPTYEDNFLHWRPDRNFRLGYVGALCRGGGVQKGAAHDGLSTSDAPKSSMEIMESYFNADVETVPQPMLEIQKVISLLALKMFTS